MGLPTTDVDLVVGDHRDVHSAHHHDWMLGLFAVQKFGKINLDTKNTRVAFSQRDIYLHSLLNYATPNQRNIFLCVYYSPKRNSPCIWYVKVFNF